MVVSSHRQNAMKFASDIPRVAFGRTDVLIGANDAPSPELSYGHTLKGASFQEFSRAGIFFIFAANRIVKLKTL